MTRKLLARLVGVSPMLRTTVRPVLAAGRNFFVGVFCVVFLVALVVVQGVLEKVAGAEKAAGAQTSAADQVPIFQVDPLWPKPLPNDWVIGAVIGVSVDAEDRVWMLHRPATIEPSLRAKDAKLASFCCTPAPPVLVFDQAGNLVKSWGPNRALGEGTTVLDGGPPVPGWEHWPQSEHGLSVDHMGYVWLTGQGQKDSRILKYTQDGKFLMQIGHFDPYGTNGPGHGGGPDSYDTQNFNRPTKAIVDPATNEVYVSDGYGNRRVIVFDADTGEFKRFWGAYGKPPNEKDPYNSKFANVDEDYNPDIVAQSFGRAVHGVAVSKDGLVYVADRTNNRVQVFRTDGTFVKEGFIDKYARRTGSASDVAFSSDPQQRFLYVPDTMNNRVHILDRDSMKIVSSFGRGGNNAGQFDYVHSIAADSKGNIYTGDTIRGKRLQRFVYKGMGPRSQ